MKILTILAALGTSLVAVSCASTVHDPNAIAISNVNVITMTEEGVLRDRTVIVAGGEIVDIGGPRAALRAGTVIDGDGGYLMPGLSDMHAHLGLILPWDGDPSMDGMQSDLLTYLPNGVTTIRNMRATPGILDLRNLLNSGEITGPHLIASGPSLHSELPDSFGPKVLTLDEAEVEVTRQHEAGYDFIKVHQDLPQEAYDAVIETAAIEGLLVAGHAQLGKPAAETVRMSSIEHTEEIGKLLGERADFSEAPEMLEAIASSGAYVTPTLVVFETIHQYLTDEGLDALYARPATAFASAYWRQVMLPDTNYFRQSFGEAYEELAPVLREDSIRLQKITGQLHEAGVPLLLGTDAVGLVAPGFSVHDELELLVSVGLSPYEALKTGTVNPAAWIGNAGKEGVIVPGARADLILLLEDPLADISATRQVNGVMRAGRWLDREALDAMLEERRSE